MYYDEERIRLRLLVVFMLQVLPGAEEEVARYSTSSSHSALWSLTISETLLNAIYGDEPFKRLSEEELSLTDCSRERFNALLTQ